MQNQINTTPISQFAQLVRAAELNQSKDVKLTINQARMLNLALLELLEKVNRDYETMFNQLKQTPDTSVISISMDGGGFEDTK